MASPLACALLALRTSYLRVGGLQSRPESESRRLTLGDVRAWQKCSSRTSREWRSLWRRRGRTKEVSIFKCEKLRCIYASLCSSEVTRALPLYRHTCSESSAKHQKDRKQKFSGHPSCPSHENAVPNSVVESMPVWISSSFLLFLHFLLLDDITPALESVCADGSWQRHSADPASHL